jgi:hypothetical protein
VIPSRTTVSEFCQSEAKADREVFVTHVNAFIERHGMIGVTTDTWQDSYRKKNYVAVTVHMIQNGTLLSRVLQVYQCITDQMTNEFCVGPEKNFDIAKFGYDERIQCMFPMLSRVAIGILSIPASSASSERVFSTTGRVLEKRRTQLSSKSVDSIAYLHSKYHTD